MESGSKRKCPSTPGSNKSLRQKFARSLRGKPKFVEGNGDPLKVYLRVRPFTNAEVTAGESQRCLEIENLSSVLMHPPKDSFTFKHQTRQDPTSQAVVHRFNFSQVFGPDASQHSFFQGTTMSVVNGFVNGENCLVFSYGVTNAGKTYTIYGSSSDEGILPRTFNVLFNSFRRRIHKRTNVKPKMFCDAVKLTNAQESKEESKKRTLMAMVNHMNSDEVSCDQGDSVRESNASSLGHVLTADLDKEGSAQFAFWVSFAEIYNEQIFDLLEPNASEKEKKRTVLKLGDDKNGNPYIKGLRHILVSSAEEARKVLEIGRQNQRNASTRLNTKSSRSHCVFNLKLARLKVSEDGEPDIVRVSQLSFVDLAGSERYTKTQNTGERLKEAGNINTSIMTLGKCVEMLKYNQSHPANQKNIPFRESKLTRLFQVFFCGLGKVTMIVNVNQCASAFDETLHALKFSAIAGKVATINIEASHSVSEDHDVQRLLSVVKDLQSRLADETIKNAMMELKIREEVSQEMAEQISEIESNYSKHLMEELDTNKEVFEQRMELLTKSVRKARRRRPCMEIFQHQDDEWVSSVLYHREQMKVKEKDQIIKCMKETIESQAKIINKLRQEASCGASPRVHRARENSCERFFDDILSTPPSLHETWWDRDNCPKSNKRKIMAKLESLVESGSSISRSAKKLKRKVFRGNVSSPSSFSLPSGTPAGKCGESEEKFYEDEK